MKLKQNIAISLCALYAFSIIGFALSYHFCGGKLADISVYTKTSCKICKSEPSDKKDDNCCKNTIIDVKVKDSHQLESNFKLPKLFSLASYFPARLIEVLRPIFPAFFSKLENKAPPGFSGVSFQIIHCVFRI